MPKAKTLFESEVQLPQQGRNSPCTPPLQSIQQRAARGLSDEPNGKLVNILDWSPQTPESIPIVSINDTIAAAPTSSGSTPADDAAAAGAAHNDEENDGSNEEGSLLASSNEGTMEGSKRHLYDGVVPGEGAPEESASNEGPTSPQSSSSATAAPTHSPPARVDPQAEPRPPVQRSSAPTVAAAAPVVVTAGPSTTGGNGNNTHNRGIFFPNETDATVMSTLFAVIASYCDLPTVVQLMQLSRASHQLATSDEVWKPILCSMNLPPLLAAYDRSVDYYDFFLNDVVTTRALHGHYTFQAANNMAGSHESASNASGSRTGGGSNRDHLRDDDSLQEDIFNIASLQLLISAASLGQSNHLIGRVQLLLTYKNDSMEVLQGSCRFSIFRRCFSLCCSAFGTVKRGPVFTVAVATVTKPWANEGFQHFSEHKNGIRLVMTPVLWEGQSPGSQITEKDILMVSRPRPVMATSTTARESA
jgi:hypothetical protein